MLKSLVSVQEITNELQPVPLRNTLKNRGTRKNPKKCIGEVLKNLVSALESQEKSLSLGVEERRL